MLDNRKFSMQQQPPSTAHQLFIAAACAVCRTHTQQDAVKRIEHDATVSNSQHCPLIATVAATEDGCASCIREGQLWRLWRRTRFSFTMPPPVATTILT